MTIEVKVPEVGESIREVQIAQWFKQPGQWVEKNENLVELDTDKATVQLAAPASGTLAALVKAEGEIANVGEVIAVLDETAVRKPSDGSPAKPSLSVGAATGGPAPPPAATPAPPAAPPAPPPAPPQAAPPAPPPAAPVAGPPAVAASSVMPAAELLLQQYGLAASQVSASGPGGRLLKEDVLRHVTTHALPPAAAQPAAEKPPVAQAPAAIQPAAPALPPMPAQETPLAAELASLNRQEEIVPMTMIRRRIAQRLVEAQQNAALLTTFNEADMSAVMELRKRHRESFQERYSVKLGFMSFFVKATIEALKRFPQVNAEVRGDSIVYRNYYDIGIAVGGGRGLVVPVLRNAERMSFAEVESTIEELGRRARDNQLKPEELLGGTFTISNGGIYGSLLSTPIVNPPQSGILGLHAIQDRPVARDGQVVIRPMMYLALTYDHRIVDGREAVGFLRAIKEIIEEPARLILEV